MSIDNLFRKKEASAITKTAIDVDLEDRRIRPLSVVDTSAAPLSLAAAVKDEVVERVELTCAKRYFQNQKDPMARTAMQKHGSLEQTASYRRKKEIPVVSLVLVGVVGWADGHFWWHDLAHPVTTSMKAVIAVYEPSGGRLSCSAEELVSAAPLAAAAGAGASRLLGCGRQNRAGQRAALQRALQPAWIEPHPLEVNGESFGSFLMFPFYSLDYLKP